MFDYSYFWQKRSDSGLAIQACPHAQGMQTLSQGT